MRLDPIFRYRAHFSLGMRRNLVEAEVLARNVEGPVLVLRLETTYLEIARLKGDCVSQMSCLVFIRMSTAILLRLRILNTLNHTIEKTRQHLLSLFPRYYVPFYSSLSSTDSLMTSQGLLHNGHLSLYRLTRRLSTWTRTLSAGERQRLL